MTDRMIDVPVADVQSGDTVGVEAYCSRGGWHYSDFRVASVLPTILQIDGCVNRCHISRRNIVSVKRPAPDRRVKDVEWAVERTFNPIGYGVVANDGWRACWFENYPTREIRAVKGNRIIFYADGNEWMIHKRNCDLIERRKDRK